MKQLGKYTYEYPRPVVTTDCVIFGFDEGKLKILLIERSIEPFIGRWALPGGFVGEEKTAKECAKRILQKETCLNNIFMEQLYTFSDVERASFQGYRYRILCTGKTIGL